MKNLILSLSIMVLMTGIVSISYGQEANKKSVEARKDLKDSKQDVDEARESLKRAQEDSVFQYKAFKEESALKIKHNENRIAELREQLPEIEEKDRIKYHNNLIKLEKKNAGLKRDLAEYTGESDWSQFKTKFSNDLSELGKSLTDFGN